MPSGAFIPTIISLYHHKVRVVIMLGYPLAADIRLILLISVTIVVRNVFLAFTVRLIQSLPEALPKKFNQPLVWGTVFIQTLKIEPAKVIRKTSDTLKNQLSPIGTTSVQVPSLAVSLKTGSRHSRSALCYIYLPLDPFRYLILIVPVESRV